MSAIPLTGTVGESAVLPSRAVVFGKMPGQGDFVHRGLSERLLAAWDKWATHSFAHAHQELGEQFGGLHDGAVPWCFVAGPGDFGEQWRVGVLAPSKDSVGRRFVLALALDDLRFGEAIAGAARLITEQLALLYRVFEDAMDADAARTLLSACAPHEDGGHGVAFDLILQPRNSGAWWPYAQEVGAEEIIIGADPPPDLVWRMLTSRNGDRDS